MFLEISRNSQENTCKARHEACNFIKKEILAQVFSCEFCKISKNTFGRLILNIFNKIIGISFPWPWYGLNYLAICKPRNWNLGIEIGTGTDTINANISSSIRPMDTKPSRVVV